MKISIVIPTYERSSLLQKTLEKLGPLLLNETEVRIIDDSKIDLNEAIKEKFHSRVHYHFQQHKSTVSEKRNLGANLALGEYLIFLDDDDDFTQDWLGDFLKEAYYGIDLVFCKMKVILPDGTIYLKNQSEAPGSSRIPGSWMIRKTIFNQIGGFDSRLKFAENTELFFRLDEIELKKEFISKENFIYRQSEDGGSKNLQNMTESIQVILDKHQDTLGRHVKYLYHQILGVNWMRFQNYPEARKNLLKAWLLKPYEFGTLARLFISIIPSLSKRIYPKIILTK